MIAADGSRRRARKFRMTSLECSSAPSASAQAASTAAMPSVNTAPRISIIWRSPSRAPTSLRRMPSIARQQPVLERGAGALSVTVLIGAVHQVI